MKTEPLQFAVALLLFAVGPCPTALAQDAPYLDILLVDDVTPLEAKLAQRTTSSGSELFVAGLWNDGMQNMLDMYRFDAGPGGVSLTETHSGVDSGDAFALGDFCVGPDFAVLPYINNDFKVHYARWNLNTESITTGMIAASATSTHTTTDCSTLDNGTFVISSTNYAGIIDYYSSVNQGAAWNLDYTYTPPAGTVLGPFIGAYRDSSDAVGNDVGTVFQHSSGSIHAIKVDLGMDMVLGPMSIYSHPGHIGNGLLKECDGYQWGGNAIGLCNSGYDAWGGWIDVANGSLGTLKLNDVDAGSELPFQGVSVSGGIFPFGGFRNQARGSDPQYHFFTDKHVVVVGSSQGWSNPVLVPGYPFAGNGGPVDSITVPELDRMYVVGVAVEQATSTPYFGIATMNPALVFDVIFANGFEPSP